MERFRTHACRVCVCVCEICNLRRVKIRDASAIGGSRKINRLIIRDEGAQWPPLSQSRCRPARAYKNACQMCATRYECETSRSFVIGVRPTFPFAGIVSRIIRQFPIRSSSGGFGGSSRRHKYALACVIIRRVYHVFITFSLRILSSRGRAMRIKEPSSSSSPT